MFKKFIPAGTYPYDSEMPQMSMSKILAYCAINAKDEEVREAAQGWINRREKQAAARKAKREAELYEFCKKVADALEYYPGADRGISPTTLCWLMIGGGTIPPSTTPQKIVYCLCALSFKGYLKGLPQVYRFQDTDYKVYYSLSPEIKEVYVLD